VNNWDELPVAKRFESIPRVLCEAAINEIDCQLALGNHNASNDNGRKSKRAESEEKDANMSTHNLAIEIGGVQVTSVLGKDPLLINFKCFRQNH
jgi:hypothetical protein